MRRITVGVLLIIVMAAFASGCSNSKSTPTPTPGSIYGNWTHNVTVSTSEAAVKITFNQDGTFLFAPLGEASGHTETVGQYAVSGKTIIFTDEDCGSSGVYSFNITGDRLGLSTQNDSCIERSAALWGMWNRTDVK